MAPGPKLEDAKALIAQAATEAGRDPATIGMQGQVTWGERGLDAVIDHIGRWRNAGASHVGVNTMGAGFGSVDHHLRALALVAEALSLG